MRALILVVVFIFLSILPAAMSAADIGSPGSSTVTYTKDIAPIVFGHCAVCHRPGQSAPFNLLTYEDVHKHAKQIVDVVQKRYMPPWLPAPGHGEFADVRRLTEDQIQTIQRWVT